jgi:uncharacterized membrane protein
VSEHARSTVTIAAPAAVIMAVIADFDAYPRWAGQVRRTEVLSRDAAGRPAEVAFALDAGVIRDDFVLAYDWHADTEVSWSLVRGQLMTAQDGRYTLRESPGGATEVCYELSVALRVPLPGLIRRRAESTIMTTALAGLKKRVEGLAAGGRAAREP